jgi:hypothetical protein
MAGKLKGWNDTGKKTSNAPTGYRTPVSISQALHCIEWANMADLSSTEHYHSSLVTMKWNFSGISVCWQQWHTYQKQISCNSKNLKYQISSKSVVTPTLFSVDRWSEKGDTQFYLNASLVLFVSVFMKLILYFHAVHLWTPAKRPTVVSPLTQYPGPQKILHK